MTQHYSNPARESDPHALPDIETFHVRLNIDGPIIRGKNTVSRDCPLCNAQNDDRSVPLHEKTPHREHVGWYWWSCLPGCLPNGDPTGPFAIGPFDTEQEALDDARDGMETGDHTAECVESYQNEHAICVCSRNGSGA